MRRIITLLVFLLLAIPVYAQSESSWLTVQALARGHKIEVVNMQLAKTSGELVSATEEAITVRAGRDETTVRREDVLRVSSRGKSKRLRNAAIGAAIGAAAGLVTGALIDNSFTEDGEHIAKTILTPAGAGAGAGIGSAFAGYETLYRAPVRKKP